MPLSNGNLETSTPSQSQSNSNDGNNDVAALLKKPSSDGRNQQQPNGDDKKLSLHDLFQKSNPDDPDDDSFSVEDDEPDDPTKPVDSIDRLVKRLKMKPEEVYAIKVPMRDGAEPMTLGDLKDRVGELVDLDARELEFNERRIRSEGELLRAQQEVNSLLGALPKQHLTDALIEKVRKHHDAISTRERQLTLQHIPSWNDQRKRLEDSEGMIEMLSDYGFAPSFLETIVDHRAVKFIRDMYLMRRRIQKALSEVTVPPKKGNKAPSAKGSKAPKRPTDDNRSRRQGPSTGRARIMQLLNSGDD